MELVLDAELEKAITARYRPEVIRAARTPGKKYRAIWIGGPPGQTFEKLKAKLAELNIIVEQQAIDKVPVVDKYDVVLLNFDFTGHQTYYDVKKLAAKSDVPLVLVSHRWSVAMKNLKDAGFVDEEPAPQSEQEPAKKPPVWEPKRMFADMTDDELLGVGVPDHLLHMARSVIENDEDGLLDLVDRLPDEAAEALLERGLSQSKMSATPMHLAHAKLLLLRAKKISAGTSVEARRMKSDRTVMFHGTVSGPNQKQLKSILKHGLLPNPKERVWQSDPEVYGRDRSRASYEGIYFTQGLRIALSSASNAIQRSKDDQQYPVIVSAVLQLRSAIPDEDNYTGLVDSAYAKAKNAPADHEWSNADMYLTMHGADAGIRSDRDDKTKFEEYIRAALKTKKAMPDQLDIRSLTDELFDAEVVRRISLLAPSGTWGHDFERLVTKEAMHRLGVKDQKDLPEPLRKQPTYEEGERGFRSALDKLMKATRRTALGKKDEDYDKHFHTARVTEPVTFSGRNRIKAIVSLPNKRTRWKQPLLPNGRFPPLKVIVHYGDPSDILSYLKSEEGDDFEVIKAPSPTAKLDAGTLAQSLGLALGLGLSPAPDAGNTTSAPPEQIEESRLIKPLQTIAQLESRGRHNISHKEHSKGAWNTAFGSVGLKPSSAYEQYKRSSTLKAKYPGLDDEQAFEERFRSDEDFYVDIANDHWDWLKAKLKTDERVAYAWRFGRGAALKATDEQVASSSYVKTFLSHLSGVPLSSATVTTDETGKFWGSQGAGAIFFAEDTGRFLIQLRSPYVNEPDTWGVIGGAIDAGEDPQKAMEREVQEETGYSGPMKSDLVYTFQSGKFRYHNYVVTVPHEFEPEHGWESTDHVWATLDDLPTPLHFGLKAALPSIIDWAEKKAGEKQS